MLVNFISRTNYFKGISIFFILEDHSFNQTFVICVFVSRNLYLLSSVIGIIKKKKKSHYYEFVHIPLYITSKFSFKGKHSSALSTH